MKRRELKVMRRMESGCVDVERWKALNPWVAEGGGVVVEEVRELEGRRRVGEGGTAGECMGEVEVARFVRHGRSTANGRQAKFDGRVAQVVVAQMMTSIVESKTGVIARHDVVQCGGVCAARLSPNIRGLITVADRFVVE